MQSMSKNNAVKKNEVIRESLPPGEGKFAYVIFVAVTIIAITVTLPLGIFGIVFGKFLSTVGDETTGTSLANGMFNTVLSFTGLVTNVLLNIWSCRTVGLLGVLFCVIGCFGLIFANDLISFIIFFGIFQGFGYGLLLPASLTALNNVFEKKLSFMMSLSQALMVACFVLMPPCASVVMDTWGYRGALLCICGVTLVNLPAAIVLTPFHCNRKNNNELGCLENNDSSMEDKLSAVLTDRPLLEPFLKQDVNVTNFTGPFRKEVKALHIADTTSISSINRYVSNYDEEDGSAKPFWHSVTSLVDFSLLKQPKYLNVSIGLSLSFTSDVCFISMLPLVLTEYGFNSHGIALAMSVFFGSDLVSRILLSIVSNVTTVNSRHLVLGGSLFSVIFRLAFVWCKSYLGTIIVLAFLGFLRCFIQTPLPLVLSEEYPDQFATAYSLYMVVCGIVTLVFGPLMGLVKSTTNSNDMVCHLLTISFIICVISWLCEMALGLGKRKRADEDRSAEKN